jgi:hypothetical protein
MKRKTAFRVFGWMLGIAALVAAGGAPWPKVP